MRVIIILSYKAIVAGNRRQKKPKKGIFGVGGNGSGYDGSGGGERMIEVVDESESERESSTILAYGSMAVVDMMQDDNAAGDADAGRQSRCRIYWT